MKRHSQRSRSSDRTSTGIAVKVQPGASRDRVIGKAGEEWKIAVTAPPVEGRANRACTEFLSRLLDLPRSAVTIVRGETARHKIIAIDGMLPNEVESKLEHAARSTT